MLALQRHREILNILAAEGQIRVPDLATRFEVTEETIRRDLASLEAQGGLVRTHGGALPSEKDSMHEQPYWKRELFMAKEKRAIARRAVENVAPGETIMIDGSSSALCAARELPDLDVTVLTHSLQVAWTLADREHVNIVGIGGRLSRFSLSFIGSKTVNDLREYHANTLFFSCRGISLDWGLSDANEEQAILRGQMLTNSEKSICLADHSKFNVTALRHVADFADIDALITDDQVDDAVLKELRDKHVDIDVVRPGKSY